MTRVKITEEPKVAVIGAGYWGKNLVRNFAGLGALSAVVDSNAERRAVMGEAYPKAEMLTEMDQVLSDDTIAGVVISTPAETHGQLVRRALKAGKHVFVEKPLCLDLAEGKELCELARQNGLVLMVGHLLHYHSAVVRLKKMVNDGQLGKVNYIYSNRLNLGKVRQEENILWSFAPHDVSLILALTGEMPEKATCFGGNYLQPNVADVTMSTLDFASGTKAHIYVSWLHPFKEQKLVVVGTEGMAVFDDTQPKDKLLFYPHRIHWKDHAPVPEKVDAQVIELEASEPLRNECAHFLECVSKGLTPLTDGDEGLDVLSVLDACQKSLEAGGGVQRVTQRVETHKEPYKVDPTAVVDPGVEIGQGSRIWHFSHIIKGSRIGENCNLGQNVMVGPDVVVGDGVKIQNNVSVYKGVTLEDDVFCGPSMVFTNVYNPRSAIGRKDELRPTLVKKGASLGANSTVVCGSTIGRFAFVAAGAVVKNDVPDFAMVAGNPASVKGWICSCGSGLTFDEDKSKCQTCGAEYEKSSQQVKQVKAGELA